MMRLNVGWLLAVVMMASIVTARVQTSGAAEMPPVDVPAIMAAAPAAEEFPEADAVVLFQRITYQIDVAGRTSRRVHQLHKLFTEWACRNLSDLRSGWDATRQELVVHTCRTTMRDGKVVDTPANGFNEVTPDAVAGCPPFLARREMVISHVGVERGCIIELDYEIRDLELGAVPASGLDFLQGSLPILTKQVVISAPLDLFLNWQGVNGASAEPVLSKSGGSQTVFWSVRDVPALPNEGNADHEGDYLPYVMFSTAPDWSILAERLRTLTEGAATISPAMRTWLAPPAGNPDGADDLTTLDKLERIADLLGKRILTVSPADEGWSQPPRTAEAVFASSCGTEWEKAILGLTLLREIGLTPELAFFSRWNSFVSEVATPFSFLHLRLVVPVENENYWLSPTGSDVMPGRCDLVGKTGFFLEVTPQGFRTYVVPPVPSECVLAVNLRPDAERGFRAEIDLTATGQFRPVDWKKPSEEVATKLAAMLLQEAEVVATETRHATPVRLELRCEVTGRHLAGQEDPSETELTTLAFALSPRALTDLLPTSFHAGSRHRQTPLFITQDLHERLLLRLTLPEDLQIEYQPAAIALEGEWASFHLDVQQEENTITVSRDLSVTGGVIPPAAYLDFQRVLAAATAPAGQNLIFSSP